MRDNIAAQLTKWTHYNSESINHILKQYIQWKPQHLPKLIDKLRHLILAQETEADQALIGCGDLQLQPLYANHRFISFVISFFAYKLMMHLTFRIKLNEIII